MEIFDEIDFRKRFRISKNNFMTVLERIEDEIRHKSDRMGQWGVLKHGELRSISLHYPITPPEHLYNEAQIRTRSIVERFFGIWKERFAVLSIGMRFQTIEKVLPIIMATAVLHNIVQQNIQQDRIDPHAYNNTVAVMQNIDNRNVHDKRRVIVEYFGRLI
ncbi:PREDICTED: uncharacterized protein LOC108766350 [Trachymyrmex cornetzi]|uniref:uncharacterized protein LOC108766350 n=1 Tax=Trachymyrmex cornetzi TaxID=471704 RepID=UPI00084F15DE|nr:PREDICTED: uncharacterized protein LOC108766350 [Trachymyrmex cornetzi]